MSNFNQTLTDYSPACAAPDAVAVEQVYLPGVPRDRVPMTDDEVLARAVEVRRYDDGEIIAVMFDKTKEDNK